MSIIKVQNLTKDYGSGRGVFDISFSVEKGEVFGFLGPNGSGKSTTIRHLMGFSKPQKGKTQIFEQDSFKNYSKILKKVGYVPGEIALPVGVSGYGFIKMMQDMQGVCNTKRLDMLLDMFKLSPANLKCETKRMSLGVKRKLAIVVAFMSDPDVLILDEPTSGLDAEMQQVFVDFVLKEKERGKTILLSSHIFSEVDAACDRISIIKDGKIVSTFVANDLKHSKQKNYKLIFENKKDYQKFENESKKFDFLQILSSDMSKFEFVVSVHDQNINKLVQLLCNYQIVEFSHEQETLEQYFMKFYKEDKHFGGVLK